MVIGGRSSEAEAVGKSVISNRGSEREIRIVLEKKDSTYYETLTIQMVDLNQEGNPYLRRPHGVENSKMGLYSNNFIEQKMEYIHDNPVAAGIVYEPRQYVLSLARDNDNIKGLVKICYI